MARLETEFVTNRKKLP